MNVLTVGLPPWRDLDQLALYHSAAGHAVRHLAVQGAAHYHFDPGETAAEVVARVAQEWPPDLLLCACPELMPPPRAVEDCPIPTAALISDWNLYQPQLAHNLARYDVVLTDRLGSRVLRLHGATPRYFEPLYAHRTLIHRRLDLPRDVDVMFLGNLNHAIHRGRGRVLEQLASLSGERRVEIGGEYPPGEYARRLNTARIALNYAVRREMNLRSFEAPACGALLFQEAENLEAADWLEDGRHAVFYTREDLLPKLRYYLDHEAERARIAEAGWRRVQDLTAERRMDRLFDWLAAQPSGGRAFRTFTPREKAMAEVLMLASCQAGARGALLARELDRALASFPGDTGFLLAAGCVAHADAAGSNGEARADAAREALKCFHQAATAATDQAVPWLNLAVVARQARRAVLETECLEQAAAAPRADHGGLLLGKVSDPYYADWRLALALGEQAPALLHGAAACRLAEMALGADDAPRARAWAARAIEAHPHVAAPYRLAAIALSRLGDLEGAARRLEEGLPHTAFDAPFRRDLAAVYETLGQHDAARELAADTAHLLRLRGNTDGA